MQLSISTMANGARIFLKLRELRSGLPWFVSSCVARRRLKQPWTVELDLPRPAWLVRGLANDALWLTPQPWLVDDEVSRALEAIVENNRHGFPLV